MSGFIVPYKDLYLIGDCLVLKLETGQIFEGDVCNIAKDIIELVNPKQRGNPNTLLGVYTFYRREIRNIIQARSKFVNDQEGVVSESESNCEEIKICEKEYFRLRQMSWDAVYIIKNNEKLSYALKQLKSAEILGIVALGMQEKRNPKISLLVLSTWQEVFVFDLIDNDVFPEFQDTFQSKSVCKVIHNGIHLADTLFRNYNIFFSNIFDTQITDMIIQKKRKTPLTKRRTIQECLTAYLNLNPCLLEEAMSISSQQWHERPLSEKNRGLAAQLATYLLILKEQMENILLEKTYCVMEDVEEYLSNLEPIKYIQLMHSKKINEDIKNLIPPFKDLDLT